MLYLPLWMYLYFYSYPLMNSEFQDHIRRFVSVSEEQYSEIVSFFRPISVPKKTSLLREGDICQDYYFVKKGLLRKYYINDKGVEHTTEFAIEGWWMCDHFSLLRKVPSDCFIQTVEAADLLSVSRDAMEQLLREHPVMDSYFRSVYQKAYAAMQMRIKYHSEYSREELYHHFRRLQPEFLQRVPQYLIASYLGFTPEYLSEIRKKSIS